MHVWGFYNFFNLKGSLAFMFEVPHLNEESLQEYDELELCYMETVNNAGKQKEFRGIDHGDDQAVTLNLNNKLSQFLDDDSSWSLNLDNTFFHVKLRVFCSFVRWKFISGINWQ
ncbi:trafficking protein particle complex II-specific subunit 130 homolog isoform X1 [Lactuca sativa]|uniref:trafficking protein particle complex II-specific subunit 130 homolog isoform X1 n=1 Tax=Lactuca sativa TaxID=4236 RepID=UPI000CD887A7|nr:trafficking protein particle complex II-specific subunit 130 homolog isoform X1 [Lactuca sativa]XP_042757409.1 trafficking protein particle complex II-specific subunit 130 homolog isoform X1 [Lactuca sativa]XP_042757410.1 trafficking protein particle complex II-specific subunit 130 homolog isoform X1 [Lactuca sativa]